MSSVPPDWPPRKSGSSQSPSPEGGREGRAIRPALSFWTVVRVLHRRPARSTPPEPLIRSMAKHQSNRRRAFLIALAAAVLVAASPAAASAGAAVGQLKSFGSYGFGNGQFANAFAIGVDPSDGSIYVADLGPVTWSNEERAPTGCRSSRAKASTKPRSEIPRFQGRHEDHRRSPSTGWRSTRPSTASTSSKAARPAAGEIGGNHHRPTDPDPLDHPRSGQTRPPDHRPHHAPLAQRRRGPGQTAGDRRRPGQPRSRGDGGKQNRHPAHRPAARHLLRDARGELRRHRQQTAGAERNGDFDGDRADRDDLLRLRPPRQTGRRSHQGLRSPREPRRNRGNPRLRRRRRRRGMAQRRRPGLAERPGAGSRTRGLPRRLDPVLEGAGGPRRPPAQRRRRRIPDPRLRPERSGDGSRSTAARPPAPVASTAPSPSSASAAAAPANASTSSTAASSTKKNRPRRSTAARS